MSEEQIRIALDASFRTGARLGVHNGRASHLSAAVSADARRLLMNRQGQDCAIARASGQIMLDANDASSMADPARAMHGPLPRRALPVRVARLSPAAAEKNARGQQGICDFSLHHVREMEADYAD